MLSFLSSSEGKIVAEHLAHDRRCSRAPTLTNMFEQTGDGHFRNLSRRESNEPRMIGILPGEGFSFAAGSGNHLRGPRFASHEDVRQLRLLTSPQGAVHHVLHTGLHEMHGLGFHADLIDHFGLILSYRSTLVIDHLFDNMWPIDRAAVGDSRSHDRHLQWCDSDVPLPDGDR